MGQVERENEDERSESRNSQHKEVMEGTESLEVFDDAAVVYRAKWLCLSIQLKWMKECNEWQTDLAPLTTQFPQSDFFIPLMPFSPYPCSSLPSAPCADLCSFPLPLYACVTVNLLVHITIVLLLCIASEPPRSLASTSAPIPPFHVQKIRSKDWFVFVSCCYAVATAIGNP